MEKTAFLGSVLSAVSDIYWGSWSVSSTGRIWAFDVLVSDPLGLWSGLVTQQHWRWCQELNKSQATMCLFASIYIYIWPFWGANSSKGTLKSTFLQLTSALTTGPGNWVQNGQDTQRGGESKEPVKVLWCSAKSRVRRLFCRSRSSPKLSIYLENIVLSSLSYPPIFSFLMCFIIYIVCYPEINVHNWSKSIFTCIKDEYLNFLIPGAQ